MRKGSFTRTTLETDISATIVFNNAGIADCSIPLPFITHMLDAMCRHGGFSLTLQGTGDMAVDPHHVIEDTGYCIGRAAAVALGDLNGIQRAGFFIMPMDETLVLAALDISGRPFCAVRLGIYTAYFGTVGGDSLGEFFSGFSRGLGCSIHIATLVPGNPHHIAEAAFKAFGRALSAACVERACASISTKGVIDRDNDR